MWGEPKGDTEAAFAPQGAKLSMGGVPYEPPPDEAALIAAEAARRSKKCRAKDDTCEGWRIKDSEFCSAHAGVLHP